MYSRRTSSGTFQEPWTSPGARIVEWVREQREAWPRGAPVNRGELEPEGPATRLTITENGQVYNPFFRFMARFVFGHEVTARAYLEDLRSRLVRDEARAERADRCRATPGRGAGDAANVAPPV